MRDLPLRWGARSPRLIAGLVLMVMGGVLVQFASTFSLPFLAVGTLAHAAGWGILPAVGWRRVVAAFMSVAGVVLLLGGPGAAAFLALPLAAWLLVRELPWFSWAVVAVPVLAGLGLSTAFREYEGGLIVLPLVGASVVVAAWVARILARTLAVAPR